MSDRIDTLHVGTLSASAFTPPAGSIANNAVAAAAAIAYSKLDNLRSESYAQEPGTVVAAATRDLGCVKGATGGVISVQAAITGTLADDASRHVYVDIQKSTGGGSFATILTGTIDLTSSSTLNTVVDGTISSAALVTGDILRVVITVAGGSGTQADGLIVTVNWWEKPA